MESRKTNNGFKIEPSTSNENKDGESTYDDVSTGAGSSTKDELNDMKAQIINAQGYINISQPLNASSFKNKNRGLASDTSERKMNTNDDKVVPKGNQPSRSSNKYQKLSVKILDKLDNNQSFILPKKSGYRRKNPIVPINKDSAKHFHSPENTDQEIQSPGIIIPRPVKKVKATKSELMHDDRILANSVKNCDTNKTASETGLQKGFIYPNSAHEIVDTQSAYPNTSNKLVNSSNDCNVSVALIINGNETSHDSNLKSLLINAQGTYLKNHKSNNIGESRKIATGVTVKHIDSGSKIKDEVALNVEKSKIKSGTQLRTTEANITGQIKCLSDETRHDIDRRYTVNDTRETKCAKKNNFISKPSNVAQNSTPQLEVNGQSNKHRYIDDNKQYNESNNVRDCKKKDLCSNNVIDKKDAGKTNIETFDDNPGAMSLQMTKKKRKHKKKTPTKLEKTEEKSLDSDNKERSKTWKKIKNSEGSDAEQTRPPCSKPSKACYDFGSRYQMEIDNEKDIYNKDIDIINQVESDKLSSVKDHRLLTLSDDEKAFLRSRSYLSSDTSTDIRRRFEPKKSKITDVECHKTENISLNDTFTPVPNTSMKEKVECNPAVQQTTKQTKQLTEKQNNGLNSPCLNESDNLVNGERKSSPSPIVKLKRIDDVIQFPSTSCSAVKHSSRPDNATKATYKEPNNSINNKKVYYVVNKDELNRIKVRFPLNTAASKTPQGVVTLATDSNIITSGGQLNHAQIKNKTPGDISQSKGKSSNQIKISTHVKQTTKYANVDHQLNDNIKNSTHRIVIVDGGKSQSRDDMNVVSTKHKSLTVRDMLDLKRRSSESLPMTNIQNPSPSIPVQVLNNPMTINERVKPAAQSNQIYLKPVTFNSSVSNVQTPRVCQSTMSFPRVISTQAASESQSTSSNRQYIEPGFRIITPSNLASLAPFVNGSTRNIYPAYVSPSNHATTSRSNAVPATTYDKHVDKPMHIKIGETTMIVRNRPKSDSGNRKTLPAPKPKHKIADDYKKSRKKSSKRRKLELASQRCLQSKLKALLFKSEDSLHKLAQTLDLVPVDILKQALTEPTNESESALKQKALEHSNKSFTQVESYVGVNNGFDEEKSAKKLCSRVNLMQIYKNENGICSYNKHQVLIKYRTYNLLPEDCNAQMKFPCRVKFDKGGNITRISIESFHQGLYLINEIPIDMELMRSEKVLKTTMLVSPPHTDVLPAGSLSIAIGEILSTTKSDKLTIGSLSVSNVQEELDQFLKPFPMDNVADLIDKRYSSVTDRSLSPRVFSPMFYTESMADKFDHYGNVVDSESSSEDLTIDNYRLKSNTNLVRFSERAMALKVKQNELFESCRKLKAHENARMEPKKKRRKVTKEADDSNLKHSDEIVEEILTLSKAIRDREHVVQYADDDDIVELDDDPERQDVDIE
ncbi:hypothetical protein ACF0H5_012942 [Mactra antiquata]